MSSRDSRNPLSMVLLWVVLIVGLVVTFSITFFWPSALFAGIIVGCCFVLGVTIGMRMLIGHWWVYWVVGPVVAVAALGSVMSAEDLSLMRAGEPTDVVVVDHSVDVENRHGSGGGRDRKAYTHEYTLKGTDGREIDQTLVYRGKDGFDGIDEGDTITVMIDPEGQVPPELAERVDLGTDLALVIVGLVASTGLFVVCGLVLLRRWLLPPQPGVG